MIGIRGFRTRYLIKERLINLDTPTLIAWGERDTNIYPPALGQETAAKMKDADFVLLPDAGHAPGSINPTSPPKQSTATSTNREHNSITGDPAPSQPKRQVPLFVVYGDA